MHERLARLERLVDALAEEQGDLLGRVTALEEAVAEDPAPLVLLDIDGVLADFNRSYYRALTGQRLHEDDEGTDLFDRWYWPAKVAGKETVEPVWASLQADYDFWYGLTPYPHARDLAQSVAETAAAGDATLVLLTSRPDTPQVRLATEHWLCDLGLVADEDYTLAMAEDKAAWLRDQEAPALWALDDKPEHVAALREVIRWPHSAWLWAAPWNRGQLPGLAVTSVTQALALLDTSLTLALSAPYAARPTLLEATR